MKAWLQAQLGGLMEHRADSFEDIVSAAAATETEPPAGPLPPQLQTMLDERT